METERAWRLGGPPTYGQRLQRELGATPVEVRYNSGLHISENGRLLGRELDALVAAWPVEVEQIALIGHSMGGLVARSACFQADEEDAKWVRHVRHLVSLGTPHMGAPLEQIVHYASATFHTLPETRPIARFLRRRSAGIRDLRQGSLVDEDWRGGDPDALKAAACRRCRCWTAPHIGSCRRPSPAARSIRWGGSSATCLFSCRAHGVGAARVASRFTTACTSGRQLTSRC
jgi:pimeloyl-ACP methyl ester carboxylesterase